MSALEVCEHRYSHGRGAFLLTIATHHFEDHRPRLLPEGHLRRRSETADGQAVRPGTPAHLPGRGGPRPGRRTVDSPGAAGTARAARPARGLLIGRPRSRLLVAEAAGRAALGRVTVVERETAILDWHRGRTALRNLRTGAGRDPRPKLVEA
ncbi:hypothetical protein IHE61_31405, partial [Streptomyces sp. GKU 257-1]|nr:hypothetical protein [Streptomyces sp. GKU 257-1]